MEKNKELKNLKGLLIANTILELKWKMDHGQMQELLIVGYLMVFNIINVYNKI